MRRTKRDNPTPIRRFMKSNNITVNDVVKEMEVNVSTVSTWLKKDDDDNFEVLSLKFFIALSSLSDQSLDSVFHELLKFRAEYQTLDYNEELYDDLYKKEAD